MGTLRRSTLLVAVGFGAFVIDGCWRGPIYRPARPGDGFEPAPEVRVGISGGLRRAELSIEGAGPSGPLMVKFEDGRLRAGERLVEAPLRLAPAEGLLAFGGRSYRGLFEVALDDGALSLVNVVPAEDYLAGVLGGEMSLTGPPAALRAQAIAARTYVLYEVAHGSLRRRGRPFDVFDDQRSQVYAGIAHESASARELVEQTTGMVLRHEGRLFKAFYSSSCGGSTDPAWALLQHPEKIPPLEGGPCGYCEQGRFYRWEYRLGLAEASAKIGRGAIRAAAPERARASGRVETVRLTTDRGVFSLDANDEFRRKLDPGRIRSTLWEELGVEGGKLLIRGRGWGHGVGMCQTGATAMGREGASTEEILQRYYPGARVEKVY